MSSAIQWPSIALVGCGSIAENGILPHLQLQGISLAALCDKNKARVELLSGRYGVDTCYTDFDRLLEDSAIDGVLIASPICLHYQQAHSALAVGRHVYVQKTMTETAAQARSLIEVAKRNKVILSASPGQMLLPAISTAAEWINSGRIGTVYSALSVNWAPGHELEPIRKGTSNPALDPSWYYQPGGGPLRDMGIYALHTLLGLLGDVDEVFSYSNTPVGHKYWGDKKMSVNVPDNCLVSLKFCSGALGQLMTGYCATPALLGWGHVSIVGSLGAIDLRRIAGFGSRYELLLQLNSGGQTEHHTFGSGLGDLSDDIDEAHVALDIIDFIGAVQTGRQPAAKAEFALKAIEVVEAIDVSLQTGIPCRVLSKN